MILGEEGFSILLNNISVSSAFPKVLTSRSNQSSRNFSLYSVSAYSSNTNTTDIRVFAL